MAVDESYMSKISTKRRTGAVLGRAPLVIMTIAASVALLAITSERAATLLRNYPATTVVIVVTIALWIIKVLTAFSRKQAGDD